MSDVVSYEVTDGVAVITVNNPPVNALSHAVRHGIQEAIARLQEDGAKVGLIVGAGRTFIAGADISEFGKPMKEPGLGQVVSEIENSAKPVIAALHGTALGGGLEVALGAHYRVAVPSAKVGLPEVHLGIIPGAGGTQRLPRITGPEAAIEMITSGRHVGAAEAGAKGIVDEVGEGAATAEDALALGMAYAQKLIADGAPARPTKDRVMEGGSPEMFAAATAEAKKRAKGQLSPVGCVEAVSYAHLPIEEGLQKEREVFQGLYEDPQRAALVHAFFSERAVAKVPEAKATPRKLETIGVIGGGTMGSGISSSALSAGMKVRMVEMDADGVARGVENVRGTYASSVKKGRMTQEALDEMLDAQFSASTDLETLKDVDLVIEAVFENMDVKKEVFRKLDGICDPGVVLASNTSYLNIDEIASVTSRPEDVLGLHFFSPAHIMRLLEVIVGEKTAPEVGATGFLLAKKMKKVGVRCGVCDGFIGNRILAKYLACANYMVMDGANPFEIDAAVRKFGYPMGPFAMMDLAGMDVGWRSRNDPNARPRDPRNRVATGFHDALCELGHFGQKTGQGFYIYKDGARVGEPNPLALELIEKERAKEGITPREFSEEEILRRYLATMINESAKVVGEGIALRPLDVDMVGLFGYGFPRWRGGALHYADHYGLDKVLADINEFAEEDGYFWTPAPLLEELVRDGRSFGDLNNA